MAHARNQSDVVFSLNKVMIVLLVCVVASFGLAAYFSIEAQDELNDRHELIMNAIRFADGSKTLTVEVRAYAATGDEAHYNAYWQEIDTDKNRDLGLEGMRKIGITSKEEDILAEMSQTSNGLVPLEEEAMQSVKRGDLREAVNAVYGKSYTDGINKIYALNAELRRSLNDRTSARVAYLKTLTLVLIAVTSLFTALVVVMILKNMSYVRTAIIQPILKIRENLALLSKGSLMTRLEMETDESEIGTLVRSIKDMKNELKKYIGDITEKLERMAEGDFNFEIDIDYIGDFAPIKVSLNGIVDSLNYMVSQLNTNVVSASEEVTERAINVSRGSDELAKGAGDQAEVLEELSQKVRDLASKMKEIASDADRSNETSAATGRKLGACVKDMGDLQNAMHAISEASEGIGKIIQTIANIGSRTNIVAINAAIEAAKAGEAGRGFAVVANEVRNLAIMCSDASQQTNLLLEGTSKSVEHAIQLSESAAETMSQLTEASELSAKSISEIAEYSREQASSLADVSDGFTRISAVVEENAATASESALNAQDLRQQADRLSSLRSIFENFKLKKS